ncbi:MAG TPA: hypothetical protein PL126_07420, partial [Candidatus Cloacimonadota bacterium]|nr:hypothetical protein [Candidatus Cloacimonadota bacterium]
TILLPTHPTYQGLKPVPAPPQAFKKILLPAHPTHQGLKLPTAHGDGKLTLFFPHFQQTKDRSISSEKRRFSERPYTQRVPVQGARFGP